MKRLRSSVKPESRVSAEVPSFWILVTASGRVPLNLLKSSMKPLERSLSRPTCDGSVPESFAPESTKKPVSLLSSPASVGMVPLSRWLY